MKSLINSLVDFNDGQFDYGKNWLLQSIRMERGPISPRDDYERELWRKIRRLERDAERQMKRQTRLSLDKDLQDFLKRHNEKFSRYCYLLRNPTIVPGQTDRASLESYREVEAEARAIARAWVEYDEEVVRIRSKSSD
jgi:hypothetical protein